MSGYLEGYGAGEERRARIIKRAILALIVLLVVAGVAYFTLRDFREKQQLKAFLEALRNHEYQQAYTMWGCTESSPCPQYSYEKFLEDWGPQSPHSDVSRVSVSKTRSCSTGIIATVEFGKGEPELLWVERKDKTLSYAPWPMCNPRMKPPASTGL
jgi:hypothetical protein